MKSDSGHWYTRDGKPQHRVECKTKPGEWRNVRVTDARELDLVPSVTTILQVIRKPGLDYYKAQQLLQAALTIPQDRPIDDLIPQIIEDADQHSRDAMDLGSMHHSCIEDVIRFLEYGEPYLRPQQVGPETVDAFVSWYVDHKCKSAQIERAFACDAGYGGRIDWIGECDGMSTIIDWKTQSTKPNNLVRFYPEYAVQLAAYAHGVNMSDAQLMSVIISTTEPGRIESRAWRQNDPWYQIFDHVFAIWRSALGRNYDPRA